MNRILQHLHDIGVIAWVRFVQALNFILISVAGSVLVIHQAYPTLIAGMIGKLPPLAGVPVLLIVGFLVHYALRRAAKAA